MFILLPSNIFKRRFVKVQIVQPYNSTDSARAWKKSRLILSGIMVDNPTIAVHIFPKCKLTSLSADVILLPRFVNCSTDFRGSSFNEEMAPSCLKHLLITFIIMPLC